MLTVSEENGLFYICDQHGRNVEPVKSFETNREAWRYADKLNNDTTNRLETAYEQTIKIKLESEF